LQNPDEVLKLVMVYWGLGEAPGYMRVPVMIMGVCYRYYTIIGYYLTYPY